MLLNRVQFGNRSLRACLAGLGIKPWSSATNGPASRLRRVTVHVHRTTATHQLKLCEPRLTAGTQIRDRLRKTNSAKQALSRGTGGNDASAHDFAVRCRLRLRPTRRLREG